jgi:glycosyltransferase involved in cell wall biosynthesis
MMLATLYPYVRTTLAFAQGDVQGSTIAHQELMRSALKYGAADHLWVFLDGVCEGGFNGAAIRDQVQAALCELETECGADRAVIKPTSLLTHQDEWPAGVFLSKAPGSIRLAQMRQAVTDRRVPICSVVHSVMWHDLAGAYWSLLLMTDPCDAIVTTSAAGRAAVGEFLGRACELLNRATGGHLEPRLPIVSIPLGVTDEFLEPIDPAAARNALGIAQDAVVLLYVGRLSARYKIDLDPLLLAFRRIASEHPSAVLVLAGHDAQGDAARALDRFMSEAGLAGRIRVVANFPAFTKRLIYAAADMFVSPVDNIQETFGISILEAMAAGLPVVAADWSGYRDLVVQNTTGFLVPTASHARAADLANAFAACSQMNYCESLVAQRTIVDPAQLEARLSELVRSPRLRRAMGAAGRRRVEASFRWSDVIRRFKDLWVEQVCIARRAPARGPAPISDGAFVDYGRVLSVYASEMAGDDDLIACTASGHESLEQKRFLMLNQPSPAIGTRVFDLLERCAARAVRLKDLLDDTAGGADLDAVLWLLKKGLLCRA